MSAVEKIQPNNTRQMMPGQAYVSGRISSGRRLNTNEGALWLTVLKTPAQDQFSHPGTIELRSRTKLGEANDEWTGVVNLTGFPRSYNSKPDPETGEVKLIKTAENHFTVVEQ